MTVLASRRFFASWRFFASLRETGFGPMGSREDAKISQDAKTILDEPNSKLMNL